MQANHRFLEDMMRQYIMEPMNVASVTMTPSKTYVQEKVADEEKTLKNLRQTLKRDELELIQNTTIELKAHQEQVKMFTRHALTLFTNTMSQCKW
jgi:Zn-dependent M16 (insulinase) family peptidase